MVPMAQMCGPGSRAIKGHKAKPKSQNTSPICQSFFVIFCLFVFLLNSWEGQNFITFAQNFLVVKVF